VKDSIKLISRLDYIKPGLHYAFTYHVIRDLCIMFMCTVSIMLYAVLACNRGCMCDVTSRLNATALID